MSPSYITQKKSGVWYVQFPVPTSKRASVGSRTLERSLRTKDQSEALKRRHSVIAEFQATVARAAVEPAQLTAELLLTEAEAAREGIDAGTLTEEDAEASHDLAVDAYLERRAREVGLDGQGHPRIPDAEADLIRRSHRVLTTDPSLTLGHQVKRYLRQVEATRIKRQTLADKGRFLDLLLEWAGKDSLVKRITKARAASFVEEVLIPRNVMTKTKRTMLRTIAQFFAWMEVRDVVSSNPFEKVGKLLQPGPEEVVKQRRPWTSEQLLKLMTGIPHGDPLWPLVALGAYTGARREDICSLRIEHVSESFLHIQGGKTKAAKRDVPIHPAIAGMVQSLKATSTDGFLLSGLLTSGVDGKRGILLGKRFLTAKNAAGVIDPLVVFHSFRNAVLTQLEAGGVELIVRQAIVGHERETMTERVYTDKVSAERLLEAIKVVSYGPVDQLVASVGPDMRISRVSRRRK